MADQLALKLGLEKDSLFRIKAGIIYSINQASQDGHLYLDLDKAKEDTLKTLVTKIEEVGYDLKKIRWIEHSN